MKQPQYSPTYVNLLDLLFRTKLVSVPQYSQKLSGTTLTRELSGETIISPEDFYMNAQELWENCTPHEWYMVGRIGAELKTNCALWHCKPEVKKSSSNYKALRRLLELKVLYKTETTDIYLVNPTLLRRGHTIGVIYTTAKMLQDCPKVTAELIRDYKPVSTYTPTLTQTQVEISLLPKYPSTTGK